MKLFHINVVCMDFEKSYAFYTETLGMVPLTRRTASSGDGAPTGPLTRLPDGRLPGEARTKDEDQDASRRALAMSGDMGSRGVLLYWPEMPQGPYIDLLEWTEGGYDVERTVKGTGFARLAMQVDDIEAEYARMTERGVEFYSEPVLITLGATAIKIVFFEDPDGTVLEFVELAAGGWGKV
ncbi:VOC family protein [Longivirga aurantiaca]|uniref:VOC family protein n=1 Tax=Longivirga aurantiaca TaxID=1837743 RepID=A0ABW1T5G2_9ACTN